MIGKLQVRIFEYKILNMRKLICIVFIFLSAPILAQPLSIKKAVIKTTLTVTSNENESAVNTEDNRPARFSADGDAKTTIWLKNNQVKTMTVTDNSVITTIRDNNNKTTTTLTEAMGRKTGLYLTDTDQEKINARRDSILKSRSSNSNNAASDTASSIIYLDETKKIAGLVCKKAIIINTRNNGKQDSTEIWYYPDYTFEGISGAAMMGTSGPLSGGANRFRGLRGLNKLSGFPMQFEINMNRGRKISVEVTKIDLKQEIADTEFETPKGYEIRTAKDMQNNMDSGRPQTQPER